MWAKTAKILAFGLTLLAVTFQVQADDEWLHRDSLKTDVEFWKNIFTRYGRDQHIIHDTDFLNVVYKIVTFDSMVSERVREKHVEKVKDEIKIVLLHMAKKQQDIAPESSFEKQIWEQFGQSRDPVVYREASKRIRAQQGMRENFEAGLSRSLHYLPFMKQVFRQKGIPEELAYLPHIESSFNPLARSRAGAAGMWQFMRSTARLYMKVNRIIDQRYDPIVSTTAAARLLKYNYQQTKDWALAITAYNFGLAGMKRAMAVCGSDYLSVRKSYNHRRFKFASRNFYPEFLAVIDIMKDYRKYFPEVEAEPITPTMRYRLKASITLPSLAKQLNISLSQIKELNPVYTRRATKGWVKIPAGYWIHLPIKSDLSRLNRYFENRLQIADHSTGPKTNSAENLTANRKSTVIAESGILYLRKPGVIDENSTWMNSPRNWGNEILSKHGNTGLTVEKIKRELQPKLAAQSGRIIVFTNETLGHYADWLKVSLRNLQNLNNFGRRRTIYQGQQFALNFSKVSVEEFNEKRLNYHIQLIMSFLNQKELVNLVEYEINQGESVWDLAKYQYRVPMEILPYFNIHADINKLYPGDILRIPIFQNNNSLEETL